MIPDLPRIDRRLDAVMESVRQSDVAWIKQRSTGIQRAYADMMAERARHPAPTGICLECEA